jgi:O-antigen ligase
MSGIEIDPKQSTETRGVDATPLAGEGPELLRRVLLGLVTALIVARPLVLGEDPGLTAPLSDASNLVLTFLWLAAVTGWAVWRLWSRQGMWSGNRVELILLAVVALIGVSAFTSAKYKHPAYLILWEWIVLAAAYFLVRQLARTPGENNRLLGAVLASAVSLSAYAVYQFSVELPALRRHVLSGPVAGASTFGLLGSAPGEGPLLAASALWPDRIQAFSPMQVERALRAEVYATYAHPNAFAGYLALIVPAAIGGLLLCLSQRRFTWHTVLVAASVVLVLGAFVLTRSRGAMGGAVLVGIAVVIFRVRNGRARLALAGLLACGLIGVGIWLSKSGRESGAMDLARQSLDKRLDYWHASWKMISDSKNPQHFWLGVGPGSFGRYYPRYMDEKAYETVKDPHNLFLEIWATSGLLAVLALVIALGLLLVATRRAWTDGGLFANDPDAIAIVDAGFATHWEFYLGGMAGLVLGFILSTSTFSADELVFGGVLAGGRSLVWFASFALMETIPWTAAMRRLALVAGITILFLNLCVSAGISWPSVAQPLWVMAALSWYTYPQRAATRSRGNWLLLVLPLPILGATCICYLLLWLIPVWRSLDFLSDAQTEAKSYLDFQLKMITAGESVESQRQLGGRIVASLQKKILPALRKANQSDPYNVLPVLELGKSVGLQYSHAKTQRDRETATAWAYVATQLDPESKEGYLMQYQLNLTFARLAEKEVNPDAPGQFYALAERAMSKVVSLDPTYALWHYLLAELLAESGNQAESARQAREALRLDSVATHQSRKLYPKQRESTEGWAKPSQDG